jgi:hypothetical protein
MSTQSTDRRRHWAIYILIILAIIAGILAFRDAAIYMGWLSITQNVPGLGEIKFALPSPQWFSAILSAVVGIFWLGIAFLLWFAPPLGSVAVALIAIANLILLVLALLGRTTFSQILPSLLVNIVALILALIVVKAGLAPKRQSQTMPEVTEPEPAFPGAGDFSKTEDIDAKSV